MSFVRVYKTEFRDNRNWLLGWLIGFNAYSLIALTTYPGEEGMKGFLNLLEEESFQAFFGSLDTSNPGFLLWVSLLAPFLALLILIGSVMTGVQVTLKSVNDRTGELVHTLPIERSRLLFYRLMVGTTFMIIIILSWLVPLGLPFLPESIESERLVKAGIWGVLYSLTGLSIGLFIANLSGTSEKASQKGLLLVLGLYILQILARVQTDFEYLDDFNPLSWYTPELVLLSNEVDYNLINKLLLFSLVMFFASFSLFASKDLIREGSVRFKLPIGLRRSSDKIKTKSGKQSVFVRWARPLEKRFPFTADFIYSDSRTLMIMFYAIVMIWPLQLMLYPGDDTTAESIAAFPNSGLMKLITYGHDLASEPYLWYVITQAIGVHWMILLPLSFYWINKIVNGDSSSGNGEIMGSLPVNYRRVVLERIFAIMLELLVIVLTMIFFLIVSENYTGKTVSLRWEIIATASLLPLYYFVLLITISLGLFVKNGVRYGRLLLFVMFGGFVVGTLNDNLDKSWITGIFGLYDPVLILQERSLSVENYGVLILLTLTILAIPLIIKSSRYFKWIDLSISSS